MGLETSRVNKVPVPSASLWRDPQNNNKCCCLGEADEYIILARCKTAICDILCLMWALCCHAAQQARDHFALIESLGIKQGKSMDGSCR